VSRMRAAWDSVNFFWGVRGRVKRILEKKKKKGSTGERRKSAYDGTLQEKGNDCLVPEYKRKKKVTRKGCPQARSWIHDIRL